MPDPPADTASAKKNQSIVDTLRVQFSAMVQRLTPEIEPATIYQPPIPAVENPDDGS